MIVALFAFITFTGSPCDRKKKSDKSKDKSKDIQMKTIARDVKTNGSDNDNNNRIALMQTKDDSDEEQRPQSETARHFALHVRNITIFHNLKPIISLFKSLKHYFLLSSYLYLHS